MRLEVNSTPKQLNCTDMLKFTKHHFLATSTYTQKCFAKPWVDWAVVSNRHGKTIKRGAAHNSLQRDTDFFSPVNLIFWSRHLLLHFLLSLVWWLVAPILMININRNSCQVWSESSYRYCFAPF